MPDKMTHEEKSRLGGLTVFNALGPEHMAEIGRKGGHTTSSDREFMSRIGKMGAAAANRKRWGREPAPNVERDDGLDV